MKQLQRHYGVTAFKFKAISLMSTSGSRKMAAKFKDWKDKTITLNKRRNAKISLGFRRFSVSVFSSLRITLREVSYPVTMCPCLTAWARKHSRVFTLKYGKYGIGCILLLFKVRKLIFGTHVFLYFIGIIYNILYGISIV